MDGLDIQSHRDSEHHRQNPILHKISPDDGASGMKTPRRGLGMVINETKTPGARSQQLSSSKKNICNTMASTKINIPEFEVLEDALSEENVTNRQELFEVKDDGELESPIEGISRLSLGHDSLKDIIEEQKDLQDSFSLVEDSLNVFYDSSQERLDLECRQILAELGADEWDEYPPIELASRIDYNILDDLREDHQPDPVVLVNDSMLHNDYVEPSDWRSRLSYEEFVECLQNGDDAEENVQISI
ncbi:unnamed protein product [Caenorhabditis bovis]|uniref:Uncharacterized protein n=1 Tax=Caenorhabditis bovis TaxID=2654633 RepID=A0A8S1F5P5_9PELO|nr:unnamed protein product [Caenorhabditis bovis]